MGLNINVNFLLQLFLNFLGNYIVGGWTKETGCGICDMIELKQDSELPNLLMAIFVIQPTPFFTEFLEKIVALNYPKNKISLWIHNQVHTYIYQNI